MTDSRFTTRCKNPEELLNVVDIDEVADIETLLMFLFGRPISVAEAEEDGAEGLEVVVLAEEGGIGTVHEYPVSIVDLACACAEVIDDLGPYKSNGFDPQEAPSVTAMTLDELERALQNALGKTRLLNMLEDDDD